MIATAARRALGFTAALCLSPAAWAQGEPPPAELGAPPAAATAASTAGGAAEPAPAAPAEPGAPRAPADAPAPPTDRAGPPPSAAPAAGAGPTPAPPAAGAPLPPWVAYRYGLRPSASPAEAEAAPGPAAQDAELPAPRDLHHRFGAELGVRTTFVAHEGFEPYASGSVNLLGQLAVAAPIVPFELGPLAIAVVPEYDVGVRANEVRGLASSLTVHRVAGAVVLDVAILRHLHTFARVAPGAIYLHGSIQDAALDRNLVANHWTWGLDTTAGLGVLLGAAGDREQPSAGFWIRAEWGYAFAGEAPMTYAPADDDDDPRRFGDVAMPAVAPRGVVNRITAGISF